MMRYGKVIHMLDNRKNTFNYLKISFLIMTTNIIGLTNFALSSDLYKCFNCF